MPLNRNYILTLILTLILALFVGSVAIGVYNYRTTAAIPLFSIAYKYNPKTLNLDPQALDWSVEFEIADNVFGRFLRKDTDGQLVTDIPSKMTINENRIDFEFGDQSKTSKGRVVTAQDGYLSLKRMLLKSAGDHSELQMLVGQSRPLLNLQDECAGLTLAGNHVYITVAHPWEITHVLNLLNREDYSILVSNYVDHDSGKVAAGFLNDTTGPYFVTSRPGEDVELSANPGSIHFSNVMPQKISIVPAPITLAVRKFENGDVDMLPMDTSFLTAEARALLKSDNFRVYETLPLKLVEVLFLEPGLKDFTPEQRSVLGERIAEANRAIFKHAGGVDTLEFFQPLSWGSLTDGQLQEVQTFRQKKFIGPMKRKLRLRVSASAFQQMRRLLKDDPEIDLVSVDLHDRNLRKDQLPDVAVMDADIAEDESLSTIRYAAQMELRSPGTDPRTWLPRYINTDSKEGREEILRAVHLKALLNATIVPVEAAPFYALMTKRYRYSASKFPAATDFWTIRKN